MPIPIRLADPDLVERVCARMHDAYEQAAADEGWSTQQASRRPWSDVPVANQRTMRRAVAAVLDLLWNEGHLSLPSEDRNEDMWWPE